MTNNLLNINGKEYLNVELMEVNQKDKYFYVGKMNAQDLLGVYTVRPASYDIEKNTALAESFDSDRDYYDYLKSENKNRISDKDFQRKFVDSRVNDIKKFLNEEEYPFFPNTIIANCDLINDLEVYGLRDRPSIEDFKSLMEIPDHLSYFYYQDDKPFLLVPYTEKSILIIDGQHRLEGLKRSKEEIYTNYELIITFIIGYDRSVIAQQFYTINYEQKPVNKSLLYHLMGEFSTDLDELTFMHKAVKALNEVDYSPFYKRVKMLGTAPKSLNKYEKRQLSISLAFLIDSLSKCVNRNSSSSMYQPIFRYYFNHENYQIEIIRFLINYFNAVKYRVSHWDNPEVSLVSKGMGVGALIKVMQLIFPVIFIKEWKFDPTKLKELNESDLSNYLKGLEQVDFSKEGKYGGVGSAGSVNKIKEDIIENLTYLDYPSYKNFEEDFRQNYLPSYREWLKSVK